MSYPTRHAMSLGFFLFPLPFPLARRTDRATDRKNEPVVLGCDMRDGSGQTRHVYPEEEGLVWREGE